MEPAQGTVTMNSDVLRVAGEERKVTGSWSCFKRLNIDFHVSRCALHLLVSSVLQGQLPSIISCKNTVSCYFYFISFPSIFLSCFQSITPACPDLSGPFWIDHLGLSQVFLSGPSQRLWIDHSNKYMVNSDSYCFGWTNSSSKSRACWTPAQFAEVMTSPLKWDYDEVRDRPPSRNAPQGGTLSVWWVEVPPAQPGKLLLLGTAWATYSQATGNLLQKSPKRKFVRKLALCYYRRAGFSILCSVFKKSFSTKISTKLNFLRYSEGWRITWGQQIVLSTEHTEPLALPQGQHSPMITWLQHKCLCLKMRNKQLILYLPDGASQFPVPPQGSILQVTWK